jgi:filamentous hemagglutinin
MPGQGDGRPIRLYTGDEPSELGRFRIRRQAPQTPLEFTEQGILWHVSSGGTNFPGFNEALHHRIMCGRLPIVNNTPRNDDHLTPFPDYLTPLAQEFERFRNQQSASQNYARARANLSDMIRIANLISESVALNGPVNPTHPLWRAYDDDIAAAQARQNSFEAAHNQREAGYEPWRAHPPTNPCPGCDNPNCTQSFIQSEAIRANSLYNTCGCSHAECTQGWIKGYANRLKEVQPRHLSSHELREQQRVERETAERNTAALRTAVETQYAEQKEREVTRLDNESRENLALPRVTAQLEQQATQFIQEQLELNEQIAHQGVALAQSGGSPIAVHLLEDYAFDAAHAVNAFLGGVANGVYDGAQDALVGAVQAMRVIYNDPTLLTHLSTHIMNTITNPETFVRAAGNALHDFEMTMAYGSAQDRGHALGVLTSNVLLGISGEEALAAAGGLLRGLAAGMTEGAATEALGQQIIRGIQESPGLAEPLNGVDRAVRAHPRGAHLQAERAAVEELATAAQNGAREYPLSNYWNREVTFNGNRTFQRNDLIDPNKIGDVRTGRTNLQLMQEGRAPVGADDLPIQLHHLIQTNEGAIAEVTTSFHRIHSRVIHINQPARDFPTTINRGRFDQWRRDYWIARARNFE